MALAGYELINPRVDFEVLQGPPGVDADALSERLLSFEYLDQPRKRPEIKMAFDNTDGVVLGFTTLCVGLRLRLNFGYPGLMSRPFGVTISKLNAVPVRSPTTQSPAPGDWGIVTMLGHPDQVKLHWRPRDQIKKFTNARLSEVVKRIAREAGFRDAKIFVQTALPGDGQEEPISTEININENETVEQFLHRAAAQRGYRFWTTGSEFHWHSAGFKTSTSEFIEYFAGPDLLDFSIDGDYTLALKKITAKAADWRSRGVRVVGSDGAQGFGVLEESLQKHAMVPSIPNALKEIVATKRFADQQRKWLVRLQLIGDPRILRHTGLSLANFGPLIDGPWVAESVRQTIDNTGFTTNLGLRRHAGGSGSGATPVLMVGEGGTVGFALLTGDNYKKKGGRKGRVRVRSPGRGTSHLSKTKAHDVQGRRRKHQKPYGKPIRY